LKLATSLAFWSLESFIFTSVDLEIPFYVDYYLPREDRGFSPQHLHIATVLLTGTIAFRNQFYAIVVLFKPFSTVQW